MRRFTAAALAALCVVAAACGGNSNKSSAPGSTAPTPSMSAPPVSESALEGLLLSPEQINTAMGATTMTAAPHNEMYDASGYVEKACLPVHDPVEAAVYKGSGWSALRGRSVAESRASSPNNFTQHSVDQDVVLFSSARDAGAFFTASTKRWPACSNRQYPIMLPNVSPPTMITVGPVSNANGTLSATKTTGSEICQRALTVANNVAIDVMACSDDPSDFQPDSAVNIAHQIAAKVPS